MKQILILNPNSSDQMTRDIRSTLANMPDNEVTLTVTKTEGSPHVLESFSDYTTAGYHVLRYLEQLKKDGMPYDGVLLACMGDPCLFAIKEACPVPVVGIAEAAISTALLLGAKFSILASSAKAKPMMESMVLSYGLCERLASVETFDLPIDDFMADPDLLRRSVRKTAESAVDKGAEVLILGCAGMTMLSGEMESLASVPVVDPILAGVEQLKAILRGRFRISRAGLYK